MPDSASFKRHSAAHARRNRGIFAPIGLSLPALVALAAGAIVSGSIAGPALPPRAPALGHTEADGRAAIPSATIDRLRDPASRSLALKMPDGDELLLTLDPIDVLAPDARIVAIGAAGPVELDLAALRSTLRVWRGQAAGTHAFLSVGPHGVSGWIDRGGRTQIVSGTVDGARPPLIFDPGALPEGTLELVVPPCHAEQLPGYEGRDWSGETAARRAADGGIAGLACRTATIAVETDHEFTLLFGGTLEAAASYAVTLIAGASEVFARDTLTQFQVSFLRLWATPDDPWTEGGAVSQLFQFRDWWAAFEGAIPRSTAHFLSGRGLGGGVAWLPGTCTDTFGYGLSANLGGSFPYPIQDYSAQNWDLMVVAHELGHNFGAPHTHSMNPPIDGCGNGDCSELGVGTIMSYCHLCSGGLANVAMAFAPGTIETILSHLASEGAFCIPADDVPVTVDDLVTILPDEVTIVDVLANDLAAACATFELASFDATSSEGGTITLCKGCGGGGRDALQYAPPSGFAGIDSFQYSVATADASAIGTVTVRALELLPSITPAVPRAGARVRYFALDDPIQLPDFDGLVPFLDETVAKIDYPSTGGNFAGSGLADLVGAVFVGSVEIPEPGLWTFHCESDDGSRLFVGGALVVDNDGLHGMLERSGTIGLAAGTHRIRVEFFERFGGAGLIARVEGPGTPKMVIPASWYLHEGADLDGNGIVDGADLGLLLGAWGTQGAGGADLDGSGTVDGADLGLLLGAWG
ncbi:MAG TPA: M12 family metallo-peptidase [Phycisphaerales bacterium]|nr:M12 family metallo-peptidase [Phycisphaerales bacterium]HMP36453.1 M12 family metallo-peptidase [Phycisphaerales bacterium]